MPQISPETAAKDVSRRDLVDELVASLSPATVEKLAAATANEGLQDRLRDYFERSNSGTLTPSEQQDYATFVAVADALAILRLRAERSVERSVGEGKAHHDHVS